MVTLDMIRQYAMLLPEVEEKPHFGRPGFRVRDKLFASVHLNGERPSVIVHVDQTEAASAISQDRAGLEQVWRTHGSNQIFVGLRVDLAAVNAQRCQELVEMAWRNKAPRRLVVEHDNRQQGG